MTTAKAKSTTRSRGATGAAASRTVAKRTTGRAESTTSARRVPKRKVSLSLDADVVAELERDGSLSAQVNDALRAELAHRRHQAALQDLLDRWEVEDGPLSAEDEEAIARYVELLS